MFRMRRIVSFAAIALFPFALFAQSYDPVVETGIKPYQSYDGDVDTINLATGNLSLHIPLVSFPQRGGKLHLTFLISYNSKTINGYCPIGTHCYWEESGNGPGAGNFTNPVSLVPDAGNPTSLPDGTTHLMGLISLTGTTYTTIQSRSVDGSGIFETVSGSPSGNSTTIVDQDGLTYSIGVTGNAILSDTNGNELSFSICCAGITDTMARQIPPVPPSGNWIIPGPNGTNVTYQINANATTITLPDLTSYSFQYQTFTLPLLNGQTTAQTITVLSKITFPSGGSISYGYPTTFLQSPCNDGLYYHAPVVSRSVDANDGTGPHTWKYSYNYSTGVTTVTDPLSNTSLHTFGPSGNSLCYPYETQTVQKDSGGNILKTVKTQYSYITDQDALSAGLLDVLPTSVTTILPSGQQKSVSTTYDSNYGHTFPFGISANENGILWSNEQSGFTNNPWTVSETDYGSGAPGAIVRTTTTNYLAYSNSTYWNENILSAVSSQQVQNGSGTQQAYTTYGYDEGTLQVSKVTEQHVPGEAYPANQTSVHRWLSNGSAVLQSPCNVSVPSGGYVVSKAVYFDTGELQASTDPCGFSVTYQYSPTYYGTFPTTVSNALSQNTTFGYDLNTGLVTSITDANLQPSAKQYDIMGRLTQVSYPDGGSTSYCYTDLGGATCSQASSPPYSVVTTTAMLSGQNETTTTVFDGLDRVSQTQLTSDPSGVDYTLTTYDGLGRKQQVYNPTRCSPITTNCGETTWGYTAFSYDALNRSTSVVEQDGSTVSTAYSGACANRTDEAGNTRKSCVDGLGRLTGVWEAPSGKNYETDYTYDALGDLLSVSQKGSNGSLARNRSFSYDSLARLTSATNPESGTVTYTYDADGNVITKTAPSPNQVSTGTATVATDYTYDMLNRLTGKSYTDSDIANPPTPGVTFGYDEVNLSCPTPVGYFGSNNSPNGIGRRTAMCFDAGSKSWTHDAMGRIAAENDRFIGLVPPYSPNVHTNIGSGLPTISTDTAYLYYLNGDLRDLFYPQQGIPNYQFSTIENAAGRVTTAGDDLNNVFSYATYTPGGQLATATIGWADGPPSYNGSLITNTYNNRLQPVLLSASTASGTPILNLTYGFTLGNGTTGTDNGNVIQIANGKNSNRTQNFTYDTLNRIQNAYTTGPNWGETYTIDAWGNLTNIGPYTGKTSGETLNCASANTSNQLSSCFTYDAAGNLIKNGTATYTYDAENRLIATGGFSYLYDGDGQRIEKCTEGTTPGTCATNAAGTFDWKLADGSTQVESDLGGNWAEAYGLIRGQIASRIDLPSGAVHYYFQDHLRTTNVITDPLGNIQEESDYYPYGGAIPITGSDPNHYKFTGKERDTESGLDNFGFRYNASTMGRFMTPDPSRLSVFFTNPQTWNRYSYVYNNPLRLTDGNGKWPTDIHNQIIDNAFPNLTAAQRQILKNVSAQQDSILGGGQANSASFEHAMRGPDQTVEQAQGQFNDFVSGTETSAQTAEWTFWLNDPDNAGSMSDEALARFGEALHAILDSTSPAHAGFQKWDWRNPALFIAHHNAEKTINDQQMQNAINAGRNAFNSTFGMFGFNIAPEPKATVTVTVTNCVTDSNGKKTCDTQ